MMQHSFTPCDGSVLARVKRKRVFSATVSRRFVLFWLFLPPRAVCMYVDNETPALLRKGKEKVRVER